MKKGFEKFVIGSGLILVLALMVPAIILLQTALGFDNPIENPPGGTGAIISSAGNVGIGITPTSRLTVNGQGDFLGNIITGVANPVDNSDAVNKGYLFDQIGGAGSGGAGATIVTFGVSPGISESGAINTCPWLTWNTWACGNQFALPAAGSGAPACPAGYTEAYAGFGPFGVVNQTVIVQQTGTGSSQAGMPGASPTMFSLHPAGEAGDELIPSGDSNYYSFDFDSSSINYSICSNSDKQVYGVQTNSTYDQRVNPGTNGTKIGKGVVSACADGNSGQVCNTCRVCIPDTAQ